MADEDYELVDDDMKEEAGNESHGGRNFLAGIAVGALIGAGVALLFAPARGDRTRRRLGRRIQRIRGRSEETVSELKGRLRRELRRLRRA